MPQQVPIGFAATAISGSDDGGRGGDGVALIVIVTLREAVAAARARAAAGDLTWGRDLGRCYDIYRYTACTAGTSRT